MGKIKILYTIPNFDTAGSGKVVYDLVKGLNKDLFDVEIACSHNRGSFFKTVEGLGVPIHIIKTTTAYRPFFTLYKRLNPIVTFFKSNKYDIIHSWHWSSDWTEVLAARLAGVKWLYTKKAMSWGNKHWKIRSFLANYIVTINDEMLAFFPNKKQQGLIPLGIDTDFYNPEHFKNGFPRIENKFHVITVANLVPVKGIEVLIKALILLADTNIQLTVLGEDTNDYASTLKQKCITWGIDQQVNFIGKKPDVRPYLAEADLYVIPTLDAGRREGMPMALVEAMSMGVPVLGSQVSGVDYVLKDFPELLFKPGHAKDLAVSIKRIMDQSNEQNRILGDTLRKYCENHFSLRKCILSHEVLYRKMKHGK
ncbi:glycosyltransferase [Flavobacteriaceae bacterium GSB9]|nr:glycosyltransferase [Flavobacteriaceae bacterium GSB9]